MVLTDYLDFGLVLTNIGESLMDQQKFLNLIPAFRKAFEACAQEELWEYATIKSAIGTTKIEYNFKPVSVVLHFDEEKKKYTIVVCFDNGFNYRQQISSEDKIPTMLDFHEAIDNAFHECLSLKQAE